MDMIKMSGSGSSSSSGDLQKTVIKVSVSGLGEGELDGEGAGNFEMERTGWVDWREIFCSWMMTNTSIQKFRPEQKKVCRGGHFSHECFSSIYIRWCWMRRSPVFKYQEDF